MAAFPQEKTATEKLAKFAGNIYTFNRLYPQEKVYLHFDNTAYYLGETIWFKASPVLAENHQPSPFSKVIYVELLSPEGDIVETKKLKAEAGQCHGEFSLKEGLLHAGFYEIRAYTKAMLNFGEETVFSRVFPVFDEAGETGEYRRKMTVRNYRRRIPNQRQEAPQTDKLNLSFFPEGGSLIAGLPCNVAFKATDDKGTGVDIAGKIHHAKHEEIAEFSTLHQGMGLFNLLPDKEKYTATVVYEGKKYTFDLPKALSSGYSMQVQNLNPEIISTLIRKTPDLPDDTAGIAFTCRGKLYAFETFTFDASGEYTLLLPKTAFPSGVIQITLFNARGEVLAERLAFANAGKQPVSGTATVRTSHEPYAPIDIDFEIADSAKNPLETSFSLSVRDAATSTASPYLDNIQTHLLLSSDLKGYIQNPAYYFESDDTKHLLALDLLMLVQGWRRYSWQKMSGTEPFEVKHGIEDRLLIEGSILSLYKRKPLKEINVTMWMTNSEGFSFRGKCMTDEDGKFNFALDDLYGRWDLNLQTQKNGKKTVENILLDRNISPQPKYLSLAEESLPEIPSKEMPEIRPADSSDTLTLEKEIPADASHRSHFLKEVVVTEKNKFKKEDLGRRYADIVYDVVAEIDKIIDSNESYIEDVQDFLLRTNPYFSIIGMDTATATEFYRYKGRPILYQVDNVPVANTVWYDHGSQSIKIPVSEIEKIMISEEMLLTQDYTDIYIYTNKNGRRRNSQKGIRNTYFTGFSRAEEFYSPDYRYIPLPEEKDFRRTLYWNPEVKTDKNGITSVHFYHNAAGREIEIHAEGISKTGIPFVITNY
jgi:hypothetical protein